MAWRDLGSRRSAVTAEEKKKTPTNGQRVEAAVQTTDENLRRGILKKNKTGPPLNT